MKILASDVMKKHYSGFYSKGGTDFEIQAYQDEDDGGWKVSITIPMAWDGRDDLLISVDNEEDAMAVIENFLNDIPVYTPTSTRI